MNVAGLPKAYMSEALEAPELAALRGIKFAVHPAVRTTPGTPPAPAGDPLQGVTRADLSDVRYCGVVLANPTEASIRSALTSILLDVQHAVFFGRGRRSFVGIFDRVMASPRRLDSLEKPPKGLDLLVYENTASRESGWFDEGSLPEVTRVSVHPDDIALDVLLPPTIIPLHRIDENERAAVVFYSALVVHSLDRVWLR